MIFDGKLDETQRAYLEEALLHMGILDALIVLKNIENRRWRWMRGYVTVYFQ